MAQGFKSYLSTAFTVGFSLALVGCTAAYNARTVDSPDWKYAANCYIRGSFGHSYVREDHKLIVVSIYALKPGAKESEEKEMREAAASSGWMSNPTDSGTNTLLFEKQYRVKGSNIDWKSVWGSQGDLSITLYDNGLESSSSKKDISTRLLKTMNYHFDTNDGLYREEFVKAM
jgi:hypothetical protein